MWNIKKTEFYLEGLLNEVGLIYITNKLHHRKCFARILITCCKTLETHSFVTLTRSFLKFCDSWIKTRTAHFLWSNLFIYHMFRETKIYKSSKVTNTLDHSYLLWGVPWNNIQLFSEGEVNSGGYIPRREASRYISTALHRPLGG